MGPLRYVAWALLGWCASALAQPGPDQPMDAALLQRADSGYRFQSLDFASADGQRHYQVWVGTPRQPAPATGYPVLYMLDGNAALGALQAEQLQRLDQGRAPLLVAVGYAGGMRIDRVARTLDYTPGPSGHDPLTQQPSGGAEAFLDLLEQRIKPAVAQRAPVDAQQQTLWGHSYGGLLVLHTLLTRPQAFQHYVAASPSLWWWENLAPSSAPGGAPTKPAQPAASRPYPQAALDSLPARLHGQPRTLLLLRGDAEPAAPRQPAPAHGSADQAMQRLLAALRPLSTLQVTYHTFPGLGHGPMLAASLGYLLDHR
jgi:predicted alpha/beta superfamily hydrolase